MKSIANYISVARIFLAFSMLFVKPLSIVFYAIYLLCGASDILDGYVARKTHSASKAGEKLDSIADLIMIAVLLVILYPIINVTTHNIVWIIIIGMIRTVSLIVVYVKYKTFGILHTYGNKITGAVLFVFPLSLAFCQSEAFVALICVVASISAIEELLIHLSSKELQINKKSILR